MKLLSIPILIIFMSIQIQANNTNTVKKNIPDNTHTKKKKDTYPGVEWKPKTDLDKHRDKYPGVEWTPKEEQNKYPGVEWSPKNGDPIKGKKLDKYPGVEWTPKK